MKIEQRSQSLCAEKGQQGKQSGQGQAGESCAYLFSSVPCQESKSRRQTKEPGPPRKGQEQGGGQRKGRKAIEPAATRRGRIQGHGNSERQNAAQEQRQIVRGSVERTDTRHALHDNHPVARGGLPQRVQGKDDSGHQQSVQQAQYFPPADHVSTDKAIEDGRLQYHHPKLPRGCAEIRRPGKGEQPQQDEACHGHVHRVRAAACGDRFAPPAMRKGLSKNPCRQPDEGQHFHQRELFSTGKHFGQQEEGNAEDGQSQTDLRAHEIQDGGQQRAQADQRPGGSQIEEGHRAAHRREEDHFVTGSHPSHDGLPYLRGRYSAQDAQQAGPHQRGG